MAVNTKSEVKPYSETHIANQSFDETYQVSVSEPLVYNPLTQSLDRLVQPGETLPTSGNNPSLALDYTGNNLTTITKTINSIQYQKTLTYDGSLLTEISNWNQI